MAGRRLVLVRGGGSAREQRAAVVTAQHAGVEDVAAARPFIDDLPAFDNSNQPWMSSIGDPHGTLGVDADAIRSDLDLGQRLGDVGGRRGLTE